MTIDNHKELSRNVAISRRITVTTLTLTEECVTTGEAYRIGLDGGLLHSRRIHEVLELGQIAELVI